MSFTGHPDLTSVDVAIVSDPFWPAVSIKEFVESYRIMTEYDDSVIRWFLGLATTRINHLLAGVKEKTLNPSAECSNDANPVASASLDAWAALHSNLVDGVESAVRMYKHSVYSTAKAYLLQQFNTMNRRPQAENSKKEATETDDYWLNQAKTGAVWLTQAIAPCLVATIDFNVGGNGNDSFYVALI